MQLVVGCFLRLPDEGMQDDEFISHPDAMEHTPDAFTASRAQFKQSFPHRARMRHPQIRTVFFHRLDALRARDPPHVLRLLRQSDMPAAGHEPRSDTSRQAG
ncbi:hypothetical protein C7S15_7010 [Burkholderia cepacia]|nr:hypothetical protein [Burkholderia cepacia]